MDLKARCANIDVSAISVYSMEVVLTDVDMDDVINDHDIISQIDPEEYVDKYQKNIDDILCHICIEDVVKYYTKEDILEHMELNDILDYFEQNLISHL